MSFFDDIRQFCRNKLKSVETRVHTPDGRNLVERRDASGQRSVLLTGQSGVGFVPDLRPDLQVATILPGLSLGSQDVACEFGLLRHHRVTHILNLASGVPNSFEGSFAYRRLELLDLPDTDVRSAFDPCFEFIDSAVGGAGFVVGGDLPAPLGHVLVHCNAGVSRAATVVVAYLMSRRGLRYAAALELVRAVRPVVRPNDGFVRQLLDYDRELFDGPEAGPLEPKPVA